VVPFSDLKPVKKFTDRKTVIVLEMLKCRNGATWKDIMAAISWQAHSVCGLLSGCLGKKMGLAVESFKRIDGERAYRIDR
jgi:Protein of unknown function (DUF3489)